MKKTFAIVLAIVCALTLSIVALAEGLSSDEAKAVAETTEFVEETTDAEAVETEGEIVEETAEEPVEEVVEAIDPETEETLDEDPSSFETDPAYAGLEGYIAWMETNGASWGVPEEEWTAHATVNFILSHRVQSWYENYNFELPAEIVEAYGTADSEELPSILVYTSTGVKDSTETIKIWYSGIDVNGNRCDWEETVTIEIPAGETVFYVLDNPNYEDVSGGFGIRAGSYGDLYAEVVPIDS